MYERYRVTTWKEFLTRREFLGWTVLGVSAGSVLLGASGALRPGRASAQVKAGDPRVAALKGSGTAVIADPGGALTKGLAVALHEPFRKYTGIETRQIAREHEPIAAVKAQVEAKKVVWDSTTLTQLARLSLSKLGLLEPLKWDALPFARNELMKEAVMPDWMGSWVFASVLGYRTDRFKGDNVPKSWADFYDVKRFPGRRVLRKSPIDTLEQALLADGVPLSKVYPIDVDRALRKLDTLRPHVHAWWTGGAQATQFLISGEADMVNTWNTRVQGAIDAGAPVGIMWEQGLYALEGFGIPKGALNAENTQKFICFASFAENQAAWTPHTTLAPTNLKAYDHIPKERQAVLPTTPSNLAKMALTDYNWYAEHLKTAQEKFDAWLLKG